VRASALHGRCGGRAEAERAEVLFEALWHDDDDANHTAVQRLLDGRYVGWRRASSTRPGAAP
jgi:hypothetical protein